MFRIRCVIKITFLAIQANQMSIFVNFFEAEIMAVMSLKNSGEIIVTLKDV